MKSLKDSKVLGEFVEVLWKASLTIKVSQSRVLRVIVKNFSVTCDVEYFCQTKQSPHRSQSKSHPYEGVATDKNAIIRDIFLKPRQEFKILL